MDFWIAFNIKDKIKRSTLTIEASEIGVAVKRRTYRNWSEKLTMIRDRENTGIVVKRRKSRLVGEVIYDSR